MLHVNKLLHGHYSQKLLFYYSLVNLAKNIAQPATNCNTRFLECKLKYGLVLTTY